MRSAKPQNGIFENPCFFDFRKFSVRRAVAVCRGLHRWPPTSSKVLQPRHAFYWSLARPHGWRATEAVGERRGLWVSQSVLENPDDRKLVIFKRISLFSHWILMGCWNLDLSAPPVGSDVLRRPPAATRHIRAAGAPSRLERVGGGRSRPGALAVAVGDDHYRSVTSLPDQRILTTDR